MFSLLHFWQDSVVLEGNCKEREISEDARMMREGLVRSAELEANCLRWEGGIGREPTKKG